MANNVKKKAEELSPMMKHYLSLKEKYADTILMYRLGDFYEMFFDDAKTASKVLELTLTGRDCGLPERAPMCGVPYHAVDTYINRLLGAGYKVAICEQLTNPGDQKGMVKRDVIRVITPGTNTNEDTLDADKNHFLCAVASYKNDYAVALVDICTGEFYVKEFPDCDLVDVEDYLLTNAPCEIIAPSYICEKSKELLSVINERLVKFSNFYDYSFDNDNALNTLKKYYGIYAAEALGLENNHAAVCACGGVLEYIISTQKRNLVHINRPSLMTDKSFMYVDYNTRRNLELIESQMDNKKTGSLLWVIDKTNTGMGSRLLRNWILRPLLNVDAIESRQKGVAELVKSSSSRSYLNSLLSKVRDLDRLITKIAYNTVMPRDCLSLADSLRIIPTLKGVIGNLKSPIITELNDNLTELNDVVSIIDKSIDPDCPATLKDGGYIKRGYSDELDKTRSLKEGGHQLIKKFEEEQRSVTGVQALKVGYNRIFGYYIEIPNSKRPDALPFDYIRKQTVANAERYVNDELMRLEREIFGATERIMELEDKIYTELKSFLFDHIADMQRTSHVIANLDCLYSLAETAVVNNYVKPKFSKDPNVLNIVDGRHPVVETLLKANEFVPNDTTMNKEVGTIIITGPNMAGKSTYIRQVALLVLLAQIGSFVPASSMELCPVDRIFTRVGASDNLMRGQSTFMVEMLEVANILNNATSKSLLILDEIGRGTSTLDGLSIAWAIVEHIVLKIKAKTLFATHYHELCELESLLPSIRNFRILIQQTPKGIVFLYKIARGGANQSFGIEVAEIAGVNKEVTARANKIMAKLSSDHVLSGDIKDKLTSGYSYEEENDVGGDQMSLFPEDERFTEIQKVLKDTDLNRCTPIEALTILSDLKKILEK